MTNDEWKKQLSRLAHRDVRCPKVLWNRSGICRPSQTPRCTCPAAKRGHGPAEFSWFPPFVNRQSSIVNPLSQPKSGTTSKESFNRLVKLAIQITSVNSTICSSE